MTQNKFLLYFPIVLSVLALLVSGASFVWDIFQGRDLGEFSKKQLELMVEQQELSEKVLQFEYEETIDIFPDPIILSYKFVYDTISDSTNLTQIKFLTNTRILNRSRMPVTVTNLNYNNLYTKWGKCRSENFKGSTGLMLDSFVHLPVFLKTGEHVVMIDTLDLWTPYTLDTFAKLEAMFVVNTFGDSILRTTTEDHHNWEWPLNPSVHDTCDALLVKVMTASGNQFEERFSW